MKVGVSKLALALLLFVVMTSTGLAQTYSESPLLQEQVSAGDLPPVEERLPANPLVVEPLEEVGTYGGTLRRGSAGVFAYLTENFTREPLTMWPLPLPSAGEPLPNLAESWEYNEDGTEVTVKLREGVKWSDGAPFTSADVEFYWNDVMLDENVTETIPGILMVNGEAPGLEVIDDYTLKFTFPTSYFYFAEAQASVLEIAWPKHVLADLHPKYNAEATYEDINGQVDWQNGRGQVTLQAWMLDEYVPGEIIKYVRNPYYWKVDLAGNQLPYFDYAEIEVVEDRQAVALGSITGDFDLDAMWVGVQHLQLFTQGQQEGRDYDLGFADIPGMILYFNLDSADPAKKEAFRNINFRRAFSLAINRQEISDVLYSGLLTPAGTVFSPATPYYSEEDAALWSSFDPEQAEALLDEAGFADADGDGFRETPSGDALNIIIDVAQHDLYTPSAEIIIENLAAVGIEATMNVRDQNLIATNYETANFDVSVWDFLGSDAPLAGDLGRLVSTGPNTPAWHMNWQEDSVSEDFLTVNRALNDATKLPFEARTETLTEASRLMADNVWNVHIGFYRRPFIVSNRLGNAPRQIARNSQVNDMPPFQPYQLFERYKPGEAPQ